MREKKKRMSERKKFGRKGKGEEKRAKREKGDYLYLKAVTI